jgi:hypothetical protein
MYGPQARRTPDGCWRPPATTHKIQLKITICPEQKKNRYNISWSKLYIRATSVSFKIWFITCKWLVFFTHFTPVVGLKEKDIRAERGGKEVQWDIRIWRLKGARRNNEYVAKGKTGTSYWSVKEQRFGRTTFWATGFGILIYKATRLRTRGAIWQGKVSVNTTMSFYDQSILRLNFIFYRYMFRSRSRDRAVSIAIGYGLNGRGVGVRV